MSLNYPHFEDRHPLRASLRGGACGLMLGALVLLTLLQFSFLVVPAGRSEGKGGPIVEGLWAYFGIPLCGIIGLFWPHTIGRLFRNTQPLPPRFARELCPCCNHPTLVELAAFEICPLCFWEDDGQGDADADDVRGGPNGDLSLTQARLNFREFGASDRRRIPLIRVAQPDELP